MSEWKQKWLLFLVPPICGKVCKVRSSGKIMDIAKRSYIWFLFGTIWFVFVFVGTSEPLVLSVCLPFSERILFSVKYPGDCEKCLLKQTLWDPQLPFKILCWIFNCRHLKNLLFTGQIRSQDCSTVTLQTTINHFGLNAAAEGTDDGCSSESWQLRENIVHHFYFAVCPLLFF